MKYRSDIDGLRALAVISVLLFHVKMEPFTGGFVGVDVFFVISGFLITTNIRNSVIHSKFSFRDFYWKRTLRLFPALFATIAATFLYATTCLPARDFQQLSKSVLASLLSLSNVLFWSESGYFDTDADRKPLLHTWSLSVEEQFYAAWPLLLVLLLRFGKRIPIVAPIFIVIIFFISLASSHVCLSHFPSAVFFLSPFRAYEFMIGAIIPWVPAIQTHRGNECLSMLGLGLIVGPMFLYTKEIVFPGMSALPPCFGTALLIHTGDLTMASTTLSMEALALIGRMSYAIYLVHWPLIVMYKLKTGSEELERAESWKLVTFSLILATVLYAVVETPFRYHHRQSPSVDDRGLDIVTPSKAKITPASPSLIRSFHRTAMLLTTALILVIAPAIHAYFGNGWAWRIPQRPSLLSAISVEGDEMPFSENGKRTKSDESEYVTPRDIHRAHERAISAAYAAEREKVSAENGGILVIGDSHALKFRPFARYFAAIQNTSSDVWSVPSCPALFSVRKVYYSRSLRVRENLCRTSTPQWESKILRANFSHVFLVSRWMVNYEPGEYGSFKKQDEDFLVPSMNKDMNPIRNEQLSRDLFKTSLLHTVKTILRSGAHVVIVSQPPLVEQKPSLCHLHQTPASSGAPECTYASKELVYQRLNFTNSVIQSVADECGRNVTSFLPSKYLCDNNKQDKDHCRLFLDSMPLYEDANHLTIDGVMYLALRWHQDKSAQRPWL